MNVDTSCLAEITRQLKADWRAPHGPVQDIFIFTGLRGISASWAPVISLAAGGLTQAVPLLP